jgi:hypothetical protein
MTDAQREALLTAHEMGYYEVPRATSLEAVAAELGVTAPSLSERLRRANANLVADFADRDLINPPRSWSERYPSSTTPNAYRVSDLH